MTTPAHERVRCVDWLRGGAVVLMVVAHSLAFLSPAHDRDAARASLNVINGLPAPAFLFAAGFALALVTARGERHVVTGPPMRTRQKFGWDGRAMRSLRRIGTVLLASLLLRHVLWDTFFHPERLPWIDVLSCIALMLLALWAVLFLLPARGWLRLAVLGGLAATAFLAGPWVASPRSFGWATPLLNNSWESNTWPLVPWAGYGWTGAMLGLATGASTAPRRTLWRGLCTFVVLGIAVAWAAGPVVWWLARVDAWVLANAGERVWKVSIVTLGLLMLEAHKAGPAGRAERFINLLSRQALLAYVLHQILLFGWAWFRPFSSFLYRQDWPATLALSSAVLVCTTLGCSVFERGMARFSSSRRPVATPLK